MDIKKINTKTDNKTTRKTRKHRKIHNKKTIIRSRNCNK